MCKHLKLLAFFIFAALLSLSLSLVFQTLKNSLLILALGLILISFFPLKELFKWEKGFEHIQEAESINSDFFISSSQQDLKQLSRLIRQLQKGLSDKEEDLKKMSTKLEALISHLTVGMFLVSKSKDIMLSSKSLPHYFPEGKQPFTRLADISRMDVKALVRQAFDSKELIKKELKGLHDNDLILEASAIPILNDYGQTEQVLVLLYDLTTIRTYEKLNMDFISNASHELRTPVTSIKGFAETIKGMPESESKLRDEFLDIIYKESLRLEHIVEHMLTLSKVKKTQLQKTDIAINDFLHYIGSSMKHQLGQKNLHLNYNLAEETQIESDKYLLSQILLNLMSNAIRYTDEGGKIEISTYVTDQLLEISVSDTGIGISQLELERIFERFYRVNKGRSRQSGGTGLGLSIVKELSHILGGKVSVQSQIGKGSQFTLTIPQKIEEKTRENLLD
ncbi:two-component system histidine kinase PnpS [Streptococcus catagoni]|uniref:two-component system histidine kinase PnpS n=1 Tax=Streptococcus catagoni TaxID=2654874 RepID=UPI00140C033B|nr:ATP-binding protein [Streptococcus catagoni]